MSRLSIPIWSWFVLGAALTGCADDSAGSGDLGRAGSGAAGNAGASTAGAAGAAGSGTGGSGAAAGASGAGTAGGNSDAGTSGGGAANAGAGGADPVAGSGGTAGSMAGSSMGGASAGSGGGGGAPPVGNVCEGAGWIATALISGGGTDIPANAIDRDADMNTSRFSTGRPMTVGDWIQVDFGQTLKLDSTLIRWAANDYARTFDIRVSDTPLAHASAATVTAAVGVAGTQTVALPGTGMGRYLLITLTSTGGSTNWWSIQNIGVACHVDNGMGGAGGMGGSGGASGGSGGATGGSGGSSAGSGGASAGSGGAALGGSGGETAGSGGASAGADSGGAGGAVAGAGGSGEAGSGTAGTAGDGSAGSIGMAGGGGNPQCVTGAECSDGNPCTDDVCTSGVCSNPVGAPSASCQCNIDTDCTNGTQCSDAACVNHQCVTTPNSNACPDDGNPCTENVCSAGSCGKDTGLCVGSNLVIIKTRPTTTRYVFVAADSVLNSTGTQATASVFERVYVEANTLKFKLKNVATGLFVALGPTADRLIANADVTTAAVFGSPACGVDYTALFAYSDDSSGFVSAEGNGFLDAIKTTCPVGAADAWEKFQLIPVAAGCKADADCNDQNSCTTETCSAGKCVFSNAPMTTTCSTDNKACTLDVCSAGMCVHEDDGTCGSSLVRIKTNNLKRWVTLNASDHYLEWTATVETDGAVFELVDQVGTQFKLRAQNGQFVTLFDMVGTTDELIASASYVDAMSFDNATCGSRQSFQALGDVDASRFVQATNNPMASPHLKAVNGSCAATDTSWEQFEFVPVPMTPVPPITP